MNKYLFFCVLLLLSFTHGDFVNSQKKYPRVRKAYSNCESGLNQQLSQNGIDTNKFQIVLVGYKEDNELEVWAKSSNKAYKRLKTYPFCTLSGGLGPKNEQGDLQVPEGLYYIDRFNPYSSYHLSLGLNYPNNVDRSRSRASNLGGDIFIHGSCVTIGCIPITDKLIEELYITAVKAKDGGQSNIPVYIFPFKMDQGWKERKESYYSGNTRLLSFWENLSLAYGNWKENHQEITFSNRNGKYLLTE